MFVSSEGHAMPLVRSTSSSTRAYAIKEILDVSDAQAQEYLIKLEMPESLAKQVVRMTGGRMILLRQARETFRENKGLSEKEQFDKKS